MNVRHQLSPTMPRSTYPVERITIDQYLNGLAEQYRRGCELSDLTCKRLARIALCREVSKALSVRFTYRQASALLA
jgi:hypothetical protein